MNLTKIKTGTAIACTASFMVLGLLSCSGDQLDTNKNGNGTVRMSLILDNNFQATTKSVNENDYKNVGNYIVEVINSEGKIQYQGLASGISSSNPFELEAGNYTIKAYYGTESAASRNGFRSEGENSFSVEVDQQTSTSVVCTPTCARISAAFSSDMATYFDEYYVTYSGTKALGDQVFVWAKDDTDPYYASIGTAPETLTYTIHLKAKQDYLNVLGSGVKIGETNITGTFSIARNQAHKLSISPSYSEATGSAALTITIDETTADKQVTITVPAEWI